MSSTMKVFLLLAVMVCIAKAQQTGDLAHMDHTSGKLCLCQRVRNGIRPGTKITDIQIYPATIFCDKVEIVVSYNSGLRYCLNPKSKAVQKLMASIKKRETSTTARPTELAFTTSTSTKK